MMKYYSILPEVVLRTPSCSFNELKKCNYDDIGLLFSQNNISESIRISSLDLYEKMRKYHSLNDKDRIRVKNSFIRYFIRRSTRCTPFGLFAGCSIVMLNDYTDLLLSSRKKYHTRLDLSFLSYLSHTLVEVPEIKCKLKFYPNNSLYNVGDEFRYIEYYYMNNERIYQISSVKKTDYLVDILELCKEGKTVELILDYLVNIGFSESLVVAYIDDLIKSQILISELEPVIIGDDILNRILSILKKKGTENVFYHTLKKIQNVIVSMDCDENDRIEKYELIESLVNSLGIDYDRKHLIQVDTSNFVLNSKIGISIRKEIESTISFLSKIIYKKEDSNLIEFQRLFETRYGDKEMPLLVVLDPEIGIGYPTSDNIQDVSLLLKDFFLPEKKKLIERIELDRIQLIILKKISKETSFLEEIELLDHDFVDFEEDWDNLPDSFSVFFEIIKDTNKQTLIRLKSVGHSSAANLLSRFASGNKGFENLVKKITTKEQEINPNVLLAEIVHLPDLRIGNVLSHPRFRHYEIVYLANSSIKSDKMILGSDIMISIKKGKIFLRSKSFDKEIRPCLTNAHNHSLSTIPLYRFLTDMQHYDKRTTLSFDLTNLLDILSYIPRIRYRNTVLFLTSWLIMVEEIKTFMSISEGNILLPKIKRWRENKKIPQYSILADGDNELFIDWDNFHNIQAFFSIIKSRNSFIIKEFLYDENNAVVKDELGNIYMNECIMSLLKV